MSYLDDLFDQLEYVSERGRTVGLITRFEGVSFSLIGKLSEMSRSQGWVKVTTHPQQTLSLLPSSSVELHNTYFTFPISAKVRSVDMEQREAVFDSLQYEVEQRRNRKYHRVEPEEIIPARIYSKLSKKYDARIVDISLQGLSLFVASGVQFDEVFETGSSARVEYALPSLEVSEPVPISYMTKIIYINRLDQGGYRVGLKTWADDEQQETIRRYIFDLHTRIVEQYSGR